MEQSRRVYQPSKTTSKYRPTIWFPPVKIRYDLYLILSPQRSEQFRFMLDLDSKFQIYNVTGLYKLKVYKIRCTRSFNNHYWIDLMVSRPAYSRLIQKVPGPNQSTLINLNTSVVNKETWYPTLWESLMPQKIDEIL
jgi:hypothetical protein